MANFGSDSYKFTVQPGTRDHRGFFIQDTTYTLVEVNDAGWAQVCLDSAGCYFIDPANLNEALKLQDLA